MCTFMNSLPSQSNTATITKKKNLALFIKPTPKGEYYKFRLLAFKSPTKNDRDYPFIERYVHQHWGKNENGKSIIDGQVICPVTKYVKTEGNPYDDCPICKFSNMNWTIYRESNKTDKESAKLAATTGRKFEAIIPVYVRNDPTYPKNKNQFRVLVFTDKKFYDKFKELIQVTSRTVSCFNAKHAVDFYIHMTQVPKIVNEGLPTQYTFNENVIDQFGFTKAEKAYDIPEINKENIDKFEFDETYYVSSTLEELQEYYNKFIKVSNDDIPEEDIPIYQAPAKQTPAPKPTNNVVNTSVQNSTSDIDDIASLNKDIDDLMVDPDEIGLDAPEKTEAVAESSNDSNDIGDDEINALVDGLDDIKLD